MRITAVAILLLLTRVHFGLSQTNEMDYEYAAPTNLPPKPPAWLPYGAKGTPEQVLRALSSPLQWIPRAVDRARIEGWATSPLSAEEASSGIYPVLGFNRAEGGVFGIGYFDRNFLRADHLFRAEGLVGTEEVHGFMVSLAAPISISTVEVGASFQRDANSEFYGVGNQTRKSSEGNFERLDARGWLKWRQPLPANLEVGFGATLHALTFDSDGGSAQPRIHKIFALSSLAGFQEDPDWIELGASVSHSSTNHPNEWLSPVVFHEQAGFSRFETLSGGNFDFYKYWTTASGLVTLGKPRRELLVRLHWEEAQQDSGDAIPFVYLPALGESTGLSGFARDRFRDEAAAVANCEYRFPAWPTAQGFVFADLGRVFDGASDFRFRSWQWSAGFGGDILTPSLFHCQIRMGFSEEGVQPSILLTRKF